jgi:spore coat polysaccharide biosynthesis protein SpsF
MDKEMKKKIGIIIQARMGSSRLPGKVLKKLDDHITVLGLLITRLKTCKNIDNIIIATTPDKKNERIIKKARNYNLPTFIGSEKNVLERYYKCAKKFKLDIIVRITSDCPFIDPNILNKMVAFFLKNNYDYIRNRDKATTFPRGLDIEIFTFPILEDVYQKAERASEKEHVTYYIYTHPKEYSIFIYNLNEPQKINGLRLTIDEKEDLLFCKALYQELKKMGKKYRFTINDIINIIKKNKNLLKINKEIKQKKV